jgi:LPXTG-site transpeptidase (sortase) family protein
MEKDPWNIKLNDKKELKRIKRVRVVISLLIAGTGVLLLGFQLVPLARSYIKAEITTRTSTVQSPLPGSVRTEIDGEFAYWDPTASYFENLIAANGQVAGINTRSYDPVTNEYKPIIVNQEYSKPMSLSIDSLGIDNINVSTNVISYDEEVYNKVLKDGLAHFKGTPVCGDGGNCFIYGHSAIETYFERHRNNPETIFTRLEDIEIGDIIEIERDGKILKYKARKIKVIEPTDFSALDTQGDKETVTLMTCTPIGIGTHRLIVIGEKYE